MGDNFSQITNSTINNRSVITTSENSELELTKVAGLADKSSSPSDPWYKRPPGLVILGVAIALLAGYIKHQLGW